MKIYGKHKYSGYISAYIRNEHTDTRQFISIKVTSNTMKFFSTEKRNQ